MDQRADVGLDLLEEFQQLAGGIATEPLRQFMNGIMSAKDLSCPRQPSQLVEYVQQVFTVSFGRMGAEVQFVLVARAREPLAWSSELRRIDQPVILHETGKHATEHPGCGNPRDVIRSPFLVTLCRALGLLCFLIFSL